MTQKVQEKAAVTTTANATATGTADGTATGTATGNANAAQIDLAPPFYRPWNWYKTYPEQGFWSSTRHFDHRGELVLQLGRHGGTGSSAAENGYLRTMGSTTQRIYTAKFDPISLTRKPNNANVVRLKAFLQVNGHRVECDLVPGQAAFLAIWARGWHVLRVGVSAELEAAGTYGEAICRISDVNQFNFHAATSERRLVEDREPSLADHQAELESAGGPAEIVELGSLREVAAAGLAAEG